MMEKDVYFGIATVKYAYGQGIQLGYVFRFHLSHLGPILLICINFNPSMGK